MPLAANSPVPAGRAAVQQPAASSAGPSATPVRAVQAALIQDLREVLQAPATEASPLWPAAPGDVPARSAGGVMGLSRSRDRTSLAADLAQVAVGPHHSDPERVLIYGQLFRSRVLYDIYTRCERNAVIHRQRALALADGDKHLLNAMLQVLREARLTVNFDPVQVARSYHHRFGDEVVNCFAFFEKPCASQGSKAGRAHMEEQVLGLSELLRHNPPYAEFARYDSGSAGTGPARNFQWTSRPCYAALDFLHAPNGGAPAYGRSFLVLHDHLKHVCSYSPVDTFALRLGQDLVRPHELATFFHFETLIAHCQNDFFGYNCLKALKEQARGKDVRIHRNYGYGGRNNYIDAQVYARILLHRDVKEIHFARGELQRMSAEQRRIIETNRSDLNSRLGRDFIFIDD